LTFELADVNLPKKSWVKINQIRTLSVERIGKKLGWIYPLDYILSVDQLRIRSRKMWYPVGANFLKSIKTISPPICQLSFVNH